MMHNPFSPDNPEMQIAATKQKLYPSVFCGLSYQTFW